MTVQEHRLRLLHRLRKTYELTTRPIHLSGLSLDFTRITDPDRVLDQVVEEADRRERQVQRPLPNAEPRLPYWAELWDSAEGVGRWLIAHWNELAAASPDHPHLNMPPRILDLGCGMGLAGTVAAALGAKVLFADIETSPLLLASLNSLPWRRRARARRLDWRTDRLDEGFHLILGADILYERSQWEYLEPFWAAHLRSRGAVILGEPGRQTGDAFGEWIGRRGWRVSEEMQPVECRDRPIRIFRLLR